MSTLIVLAIIAFIVLQKAGPAKRGHWKRQVERALHPELTKIRNHPRTPERFRRPEPPAPVILGRSRTAPPPSIPSPAFDPRPTRPPLEDQTEAVVEEVAPPPLPGDPVVISVPAPDVGPEAPADEMPTPDPVETAADVAPPAADTGLAAVIAAVFGRDDPPHTRNERFATAYAGRSVEWTATVLRTSRGRRHREPATRVELLLGYASDRQFFSDRVVAEAYFPVDTTLEADDELTIRGTLTEANVYANRLVLDHVELAEQD